MSYYDMHNETCHLPNPCSCTLCKYWEENSSDVARTPLWQRSYEYERANDGKYYHDS